MKVKVTYELVMPDYWGADQCIADSDAPIESLKDLIMEDPVAFLADGGDWKIERIKE